MCEVLTILLPQIMMGGENLFEGVEDKNYKWLCCKGWKLSLDACKNIVKGLEQVEWKLDNVPDMWF